MAQRESGLSSDSARKIRQYARYGGDVMSQVAAEGIALRYRLTAAQVITMTAGAFVGGLLGAFLASLIVDDFDSGDLLLPAVALAAGFAVGLLGRTVTVTDDSVSSGFAGRTIGWSSVAAVEQAKSLGVGRLIIVEHSGRRTRLPAPVDGRLLMRDPRFQEKAQAVEAAFLRSGQARG